MKRKNILFLDMDGVVNSDILIDKWKQDRRKEYEDMGLNPVAVYRKTWEDYLKEFNQNKELIFPELAQKITDVVTSCDVKIIWSSTWRLLKEYKDIEEAKKMFDRRGLPGDALIGYTPNCDTGKLLWHDVRCMEILRTLSRGMFGITEDDRLGAIDDLNLAPIEDKGIKFFATDEEVGITEDLAKEMKEYYATK